VRLPPDEEPHGGEIANSGGASALCRPEDAIDLIDPPTSNRDTAGRGKRDLASSALHARPGGEHGEDWISSSKIDQMVATLGHIQSNSHGEKALVFSQFTSFLDLAERALLKSGHVVSRYDGSMKAEQRDEAVREFKSDAGRTVMLVSLRAGNVGLNLAVANHVILLDPTWNPYAEEQAIGRAHRIGQTKPVKVYRILVPGTIEDRITKLQRDKQALFEMVLDDNSRVGRIGAANLSFLFQGRIGADGK
jgi:SNF2 family DNA or RNA helicase